MSDQTVVRDTLRPKEEEALAIWQELSAAGNADYKTVAERMDITEGRAGVYVRDALRISGNEHLLPRGRRSNGGARKALMAVSSQMGKVVELVLGARRERDNLTERLNEAKANAADFDAEEAIDEHRKSLEKRVTEAQKALDAFDGEVAESWAAEQLKALEKTARDIETQAGDSIPKAESNVEEFEAMLDFYLGRNPDLKEAVEAALAEGVDDDDDEEEETEQEVRDRVLGEEISDTTDPAEVEATNS